MVHVSEREDSFDETSLRKVEAADAFFFTGGNQKNVTGLMGGTPLDVLLKEKIKAGTLIAGSSAGAAMMSSSMITGGRGSAAPRVGGVDMAPGMCFIEDTVIDTHFTQRGRHGRLLTAVSHNPQLLGIGVDERTAMVVKGREFRVLGDGTVTVMDGSKMSHSNYVYRREDETIAMFDVCLHVLPHGYRYDLKERKPKAPARARASA
jgi:cyanophycinase